MKGHFVVAVLALLIELSCSTSEAKTILNSEQANASENLVINRMKRTTADLGISQKLSKDMRTYVRRLFLAKLLSRVKKRYGQDDENSPAQYPATPSTESDYYIVDFKRDLFPRYEAVQRLMETASHKQPGSWGTGLNFADSTVNNDHVDYDSFIDHVVNQRNQLN